MEATELRLWIEALDLNVARAAEILGVDRKTVDRWLAGDRAIPDTVETECRLLAGESGLYQLRPAPQRLEAIHWRTSTHAGLVYVRAPSERAARQFAAIRLGRSARRGADGEEARRTPWLDPDLVEAVRIPSSPAMPADGPFGIIDWPHGLDGRQVFVAVRHNGPIVLEEFAVYTREEAQQHIDEHPPG